MTPADVRTALEGIITAATGITSDFIYWRNRPMGFVAPQYVRCALKGYVSRGHDSTDYDYDVTRPIGTELEPHARGLRDVTWQVTFFSDSATDTTDALTLATAVRDRLSLDETRDALNVAEIGVAGVLLLTEIDTVEDSREQSVAQLDVSLNVTSDAAGTRLGYVEQWGITGEAVFADGSTETFVDEVLP